MVLREENKRITLSNDELFALRDISLSITPLPKLKRSYILISYLICAHALLLGCVAIVSPEWFIENLISPSIEETEFLLINTQIRGMFIFFIVPLWLKNMLNAKWSTRIINVAIVWVILMSALDFLKVFYLKIFDATPSTALFTVWRPILVATMLFVRAKMNDYFRALDLHKLDQ